MMRELLCKGFTFTLTLIVPRSEISAQDALWQATNGPTTYLVQALVLGPDGLLFAGTDGGGVFRSADDGTSWTPINKGLTHPYVSSLVIDAEGRIFAGTASLSAGGAGVFRSDDRGETWEAVTTGLRNPHVVCLAVDRSRGTLYAGTWNLPNNPGGVFRSTDGGRTWERASTGLKNPYVLSLAIGPQGEIYAGTGILRPLGRFGGGVFRSTDQGATWTEISTGMDDVPVTSLLITPQGHLLAGTYEGDIYRMVGRTWVRYFRAEGIVFSLLADAQGQIFAATYGAGVLRSTDSGRTWRGMNAGLGDLYVLSLALNAEKGLLFAGTSVAGIFRGMIPRE